MKFFILFLSFYFTLSAQNADSVWVYAHYTKQEVLITARDGKKLFTSIYSPKNKEQKQPMLMMRTPYSVGPYGKDKFNPRLYNSHWIAYLKENYIIILQDVRGRYMSEARDHAS